MSKNLVQVYAANPITVIGNTDLLYVETAGTDAGITGASLKAMFASSTGAVLSKTNDTNVTLTLGGSPTTALVNAASITLGWTGQLALTRGGSNASLTASNGGIIYSTATAMAVLSGTATAGKMLQSGATAAPTWSTPAYPSTSGTAGFILRSDGTNNVYSQSTIADLYAASSILYSNGANNVAGLATANSGVLVTSVTGVPSISSTLPAFTTSTITFSPTTSGLLGTPTNDSATTGYVGEFITSAVAQGSGVGLSTGVSANITSISLTAGDWDVWGNVAFLSAVSTTVNDMNGWISTTSATIPLGSLRTQRYVATSFTPGVANESFCVPFRRISVSGTTTVYLSVQAAFGISTLEGSGGIYARRAR